MVTVIGTTIHFRFYRPAAHDVNVVGDFNNWRGGALAMRPDGHGYWRASVRLPAGEYRFRYLADGKWYTDYAAFGIRCGPWGVDSVVWVGPRGGGLRSRGQPARLARRTTAPQPAMVTQG